MEIVVETPGSESYALLHERLVAFNRENAPCSPETFTVAAADAYDHGNQVHARPFLIAIVNRKTGAAARDEPRSCRADPEKQSAGVTTACVSG